MSEIKLNFIFKNKKTEFTFNKDYLIQNAFSAFASSIKRNTEEFNYLHNGEKIINYEYMKLSDLNNKENIINISVNDKNELVENSNEKIIDEMANLKISDHILCPICKCMSEIDINNFKISITNCINNHTMPGIYMNDFINTQYNLINLNLDEIIKII